MPVHREVQTRTFDPPPRLPERAFRDALRAAAEATRDDGVDRTVVFDARRRLVRIETWPADERPGLAHLADITTEIPS
jgi:hypothetical protein